MRKKSINLVLIAAFLLMFSASANAEIFFAYLSSAQEVPTNASTGTGYARVVLNESAMTVTWTVVFTGLSSNQSASHIHAPAAVGVNSPVIINFPPVGGTSGTLTGSGAITATQIGQLRAGQGYVNIHTANFPGGEIRGQLAKKRPVDFDGDGRQDYSVQKFPSSGDPRPITYWNLNSTGGTQISGVWGNALTDFPTPGDYDGDGLDDLAIYRDGTPASPQSAFWIFKSSDSTVQYYAWGLDGDTAVARDYDGDGITDVATYRLGTTAGSTSVWYIRQSTTGTTRIVNFGTTAATANNLDVPIPGDYDGDGKFDVAVYRAGTLSPTNTFIVQRSSDSVITYTPFGNFVSDYILPGDYDGDGKFDYAVARTGANATSPMVWWILQSSNGQTRTQTFGITSDFPVQGDYDGDARTDLAVYRVGATAGAANNFWVFNSLSNTATTRQWGVNPDFAIARFDSR